MAPYERNVAIRRRRPDRSLALILLVAACCAAPAMAGPPSDGATPKLRIPKEVATHGDGRRPVATLYELYLGLVDRGWQLDVIAESQPAGTEAALPIIALRTGHSGPAVWVLSGIHGEEPAGPNAVAAVVDDLAALGERLPVVLIPLCNPHGYARNWRYLNLPVYSEEEEGHSVGDSSHLLPDPERPAQPRAAAPSSPEADALTGYVLRTAAAYPPLVSIDLHEDDLIPAGYVYSQGERGADDELAAAAVEVLREHGIPIQLEGRTRFDEAISGGIIGPVVDSSIDELLSAPAVIIGGESRPGPAARTVLVFETPAGELGLEQRVEAHAALLRRLAARLAASFGSSSRLRERRSPSGTETETGTGTGIQRAAVAPGIVVGLPISLPAPAAAATTGRRAPPWPGSRGPAATPRASPSACCPPAAPT